MEFTVRKQPTTQQEDNHILRMLDRGIDDMEAGRELPLEEAFCKIAELRDSRRNVTDISDYIEAEFSKSRADRFQDEIQAQMKKLGYMSLAFPKTHILYRNYYIHKKPFPPSIIFYVCMEQTHEIHVLRVLREDRDWIQVLQQTPNYTYPE